MFERYTLSCTNFPSQSFDETGCDYLVFPMPGKKEHVPVDIYYSLEDRKGIHTEEINLLDFKEWHHLPSWYPIFQLPSSTLIRRQIPTSLRPTFTTSQVTSSYDTYTTALATQTTSATSEIKNDKSLHFQVNQLNIA